jgi:hypothetical protein
MRHVYLERTGHIEAFIYSKDPEDHQVEAQ